MDLNASIRQMVEEEVAKALSKVRLQLTFEKPTPTVKPQGTVKRPEKKNGEPGVGDQILAYFGDLPSGTTAKVVDVAKALSMKPNTVAATIARLQKNGNLSRHERGAYALVVATPSPAN